MAGEGHQVTAVNSRSNHNTKPSRSDQAKTRMSFLALAFSRMVPKNADVPEARKPTVCSALPASGFMPPGYGITTHPSTNGSAAASGSAGSTTAQMAQEKAAEEAQEAMKDVKREAEEGGSSGHPAPKKLKMITSQASTQQEREWALSPARVITQIGHNKVMNGLITHPRGFKQRIEMMKDSTALWRSGDMVGLKEQLDDLGYILLRGFFHRERVLQAGLHAKGYLRPEDGFDPTKSSNGLISLSSNPPPPPPPPMPGDPEPEPDEAWKLNIKKDKRIWGLLESAQVRTFMSKLASVCGTGAKAKVLHPEMTWVRVKCHKQFSKVHADYFYMKGDTVLFEGAEVEASLPCERCKSPDDEGFMLICDECDGAYHTWCLQPPLAKLPTSHAHWFCPKCSVRPQLGSLWVPLQDVSLEEGGLCVVPTSHRVLPDYDLLCRETEVPASYWTLGKDLVWHVGSFQAGDVVLFDWKLVHAATMNTTETPRISVDTRWSILPPRDTRLTRLLDSWGNANAGATNSNQASRPTVLRTRQQIRSGSA